MAGCKQCGPATLILVVDISTLPQQEVYGEDAFGELILVSETGLLIVSHLHCLGEQR